MKELCTLELNQKNYWLIRHHWYKRGQINPAKHYRIFAWIYDGDLIECEINQN
jgi:hypothetical protein